MYLRYIVVKDGVYLNYEIPNDPTYRVHYPMMWYLDDVSEKDETRDQFRLSVNTVDRILILIQDRTLYNRCFWLLQIGRNTKDYSTQFTVVNKPLSSSPHHIV